MKSRALGIILLAVVILASGGYYLYSSQSRVTVLDGYLGGEKIGLFEDEEAAEILRREYHLEFQYSRAGSLDMVTADQTGMDYLFPSSQTALAYYEDEKGQPVQDEIIFNTPIVLYTLSKLREKNRTYLSLWSFVIIIESIANFVYLSVYVYSSAKFF